VVLTQADSLISVTCSATHTQLWALAQSALHGQKAQLNYQEQCTHPVLVRVRPQSWLLGEGRACLMRLGCLDSSRTAKVAPSTAYCAQQQTISAVCEPACSQKLLGQLRGYQVEPVIGGRPRTQLARPRDGLCGPAPRTTDFCNLLRHVMLGPDLKVFSRLERAMSGGNAGAGLFHRPNVAGRVARAKLPPILQRTGHGCRCKAPVLLLYEGNNRYSVNIG
jgi:hypothetical protein